MDDPELDERLHRQALLGLERINRISGVAAVLFRALRPLCDEIADRPLRVLDVGCGGGDVGIDIWRQAQRWGCDLEVGGCDISELAIRMATERASAAGVDAEYFQADVLIDGLPTDWDVFFCSLFLHHFDEERGIRLLQNMAGASRRVVLVSDLARTRPGYLLCWLGVRLLTRSPVVRVDGPLSVRAAFRAEEMGVMAERAGLGGARLTRHWPQRLLLHWTKPC